MNARYTLKDFAPLVGMFVLILAVALIRMACLGTWDLHAFMSNFMGSFFVMFGAFKVINLPAFATAYAEYDLIAQRIFSYGYVYPFIEIMLGVAYFMGWNPVLTNWITIVVMLISAAGVFVALRKNEPITCACLGALFKVPMTYVTLLEDLLMAAMAAVMLFM